MTGGTGFIVDPFGRTSRYVRTIGALALGAVLISALAMSGAICVPARGTPTIDVQLIGLAPLYEALFAVANCPNLAVDQAAFARAARLYHLAPADLTTHGAFSGEIIALNHGFTLRLDDDRNTFCSLNRLSFAVLHGVLIDRGPVYPHPLPSGSVSGAQPFGFGYGSDAPR